MPLRISKELRVKLRGDRVFSSRNMGFTFVEAIAEKSDRTPPLKLWEHCQFMERVFSRDGRVFLWLVESPTKEASNLLKAEFPDSETIGTSIAGYFQASQKSIEAFWSIYARMSAKEPWNYETPWAMASLTDEVPKPKGIKFGVFGHAWTVDHLLKHHQLLTSIFIQTGFEAGFGLRSTPETESIILQEFPLLMQN